MAEKKVRYEYCVDVARPRNPKDTTLMINDYANRGWNLYQTAADTGFLVLIFRREIEG